MSTEINIEGQSWKATFSFGGIVREVASTFKTWQ